LNRPTMQFLVIFLSLVSANAFQLKSVNSALKLRGGLADIDGEAVAKLFVTLAGVDAALETISDSKSAADVAEGWAKDSGAASAVGYYLFANAVLGGEDTSKAIVLGSLPGLAGAIMGWLNGGKSFDLSGDNVSLLITGFLTYALHTGTLVDGDLALKIVAGLNLVNGLGGMFVPDMVSNLPWSGAASPALAAGTGAAVYALTTGASATQALAYSVVPTLYNSVMNMGGSGDVATIMGLFQAAVVATNLL